MSKTRDQFERHGDKKNSPFFEEYLEKVYLRREATGLDTLVGKIRGMVVQVSSGEAIQYLTELYLMTPYRLKKAYRGPSHRVYALTTTPRFPTLFVLEPNSADYRDSMTSINELYPRAKEKPNARYLGEIYHSTNRKEVRKILEGQEIRFQDPRSVRNAFLGNPNFTLTERSYFTNNMVAYSENDLVDLDALELGELLVLTPEEKDKLARADEAHQKLDFHTLIRGIDHLATRVFCDDREHALLEFLTLSPYYFWGAYDITEMNSSTNVTRYPGLEDELISPAKVFTANNIPFYLNSIDPKPSPTEDFVRNFGRRMHHVAYEVVDGARESGIKNIDYVVGELAKADIPFLADIIGRCDDFPDLKQIFSKSSPYSFLITEYVQRCHDFKGFFTKTNVAALTAAAGKDEALKKSDVFD